MMPERRTLNIRFVCLSVCLFVCFFVFRLFAFVCLFVVAYGVCLF